MLSIYLGLCSLLLSTCFGFKAAFVVSLVLDCAACHMCHRYCEVRPHPWRCQYITCAFAKWFLRSFLSDPNPSFYFEEIRRVDFTSNSNKNISGYKQWNYLEQHWWVWCNSGNDTSWQKYGNGRMVDVWCHWGDQGCWWGDVTGWEDLLMRLELELRTTDWTRMVGISQPLNTKALRELGTQILDSPWWPKSLVLADWNLILSKH